MRTARKPDVDRVPRFIVAYDFEKPVPANKFAGQLSSLGKGWLVRRDPEAMMDALVSIADEGTTVDVRAGDGRRTVEILVGGRAHEFTSDSIETSLIDACRELKPPGWEDA
jgi:hypothetical protein